MCDRWGEGARYEIDAGEHPHEAHYLKLDCSKARAALGWQPRWPLEHSLDSIIAWTHAFRRQSDLREECLRQINEYQAV
jgi:CDP-glucose 4,6-dehydratase